MQKHFETLRPLLFYPKNTKVVFPFEWGINGIVLAVAAVAALLASVFPARIRISLRNWLKRESGPPL